MPYLDDIWYVGGARVEGAHVEILGVSYWEIYCTAKMCQLN